MLLWRVVKSAQRRTAISTWKRIPHHVVKMTIGNGVFYLFFDWSIKSRVAYMRVLQSEWIPNSCEWPRTSIGGRQRKQKRAVNRMADVAHKMLGRKQWHGICVLPPKTFGRIFLLLLCSFFFGCCCDSLDSFVSLAFVFICLYRRAHDSADSSTRTM